VKKKEYNKEYNRKNKEKLKEKRQIYREKKKLAAEAAKRDHSSLSEDIYGVSGDENPKKKTEKIKMNK